MTLTKMKFDTNWDSAFSSVILDLLEELGYDAWGVVDTSDRFILAHIGLNNGRTNGKAVVTTTNSLTTFNNACEYIYVQSNQIDFLKNLIVRQQISKNNKHPEECYKEPQDEPLDEPLDEFHWHEMMDRISTMNNMLAQNILDHACMGENKKLDRQLEKAARALTKAYQLAANVRFTIAHKTGE